MLGGGVGLKEKALPFAWKGSTAKVGRTAFVLSSFILTSPEFFVFPFVLWLVLL